MAKVTQQQPIRSTRLPRRRILRAASAIERISRVVLLWLLGVGALYGVYLAVCEHDLFALQHIMVRGEYSHLDEATVRDLANVATGTNLFRVSLADIKARVSAHPWVRACAVRRKLPGTIWIYVVEREPLALLNADGLYLVDADAKIFKSLTNGDPSDFPVFSGVTDVIVSADGVGHSVQLESLLATWHQFETHAVAEQIGCSEMIRDHYGRVAIVTERPAMVLRLGDAPIAEQLDRLFTILPTIEKNSRPVGVIDLFVDRKVVVRYAS